MVDREAPLPAAGGMHSTPADLARYVGALLNGGTGERGVVLKPVTVAYMFRPHHQPDPRLPGMGLTFMLDDVDGHRVASHGGVLSGFLSAISLAPDDGVGVVVLANTGTLMGRGAPEPLAGALLRRLLGARHDPIRHDVAQRPEVWGELRGWYGMSPGPLTNLFFRLVMGAGAEIKVRRDHLLLQPLTPLPPMRNGFRLYPDDPTDPYVFRVDFSAMGLGDLRAVFASDVRGGPPRRLLLDGMAFEKRHPLRNPRCGRARSRRAPPRQRRPLLQRAADGRGRRELTPEGPLSPTTINATVHEGGSAMSATRSTVSRPIEGAPDVMPGRPSRTSGVSAFARRHPLLTYFGLTLLISWGGVFLVVAFGPGRFPVTVEEFRPYLAIGMPAMLAGPVLAGVLTTAFTAGRTGLRSLRSRLLRWRVGGRWYAVALLAAPLAVLAALLPLSLVSADFLPAILTTDDRAALVIIGVTTGLAAGILEEVGWTGFAAPKLVVRS